MGVEDTAGRGIFHKTTLKHKGTVFSIDKRDEVLSTQLEAPIIVPHTASKTRVNILINGYNSYNFSIIFQTIFIY
jgi:mannitol/fructose-specific phosphotransferase system IIA component